MKKFENLWDWGEKEEKLPMVIFIIYSDGAIFEAVKVTATWG